MTKRISIDSDLARALRAKLRETLQSLLVD
jgi:hypothetical protein